MDSRRLTNDHSVYYSLGVEVGRRVVRDGGILRSESARKEAAKEVERMERQDHEEKLKMKMDAFNAGCAYGYQYQRDIECSKLKPIE